MPFIRSTTVLQELRALGEQLRTQGEQLRTQGELQALRDERFERELQLHREVMAEGIAAIREMGSAVRANTHAVAGMREDMRANTRAIDRMGAAIDEMRQDIKANTRAVLHLIDRFEGPENGHAAA